MYLLKKNPQISGSLQFRLMLFKGKFISIVCAFFFLINALEFSVYRSLNFWLNLFLLYSFWWNYKFLFLIFYCQCINFNWFLQTNFVSCKLIYLFISSSTLLVESLGFSVYNNKLPANKDSFFFLKNKTKQNFIEESCMGAKWVGKSLRSKKIFI